MTLPQPKLDVDFWFGGHSNHQVTVKADVDYSGYDVFVSVNDGPELTGWLERNQNQVQIRIPIPLIKGDIVKVSSKTLLLGGKDQQEIVDESEWAEVVFEYSGSSRFNGGKLVPKS